MEYIDIFDENNNLIEEAKEKKQAHKDGDFHRTAHVWIINDKKELLLQKRSPTKKTHPNFWDISGAGHIRTGETVPQGAVREELPRLVVERSAGLDDGFLPCVCPIRAYSRPCSDERRD